jgi:uncharacterized iron-regulated membrane protein
MESRTESRLSRALRGGERIGLFVCIAALMLVESGYIAWLERLPALPTHGDPVGFLDLPPWYDHPRAEVTLLLTVLGGLIGWSSWQAWVFLRSGSATPTAPEKRTTVVRCLKTAGAFAVIAGADMLLVQLLQT